MSAHHENVDPDELCLDQLLAQARANKPDTIRAEYGFETRLAALLADFDPVPTVWWTSWSWRLAPLFAVIALSLSLWTHYTLAPALTDDEMMSELSSPPDDNLNGWRLEDFLPLS